ncbi:hypothetical protein ACNKHQ_25720 [Shigella flexneri]
MLLLDEPTNDLDIKPCAPSRTPCRSSRVAPWLSPTTAGSSTASPPTSWTTRTKAKIEFFEGNFTEYEEYNKCTPAPTRWSRNQSRQTYRQVMRKMPDAARTPYPAYKTSNFNTL